MGFFSWARRITDRPRGSRSALRGRPLGGLLGGPDRQAPVQHLTIDTRRVPSALTTERLAEWFARHGYAYFLDNDGDVGGVWRGRLFYFFLFGERQEILQIRGQWNREFAIERITEVLEICNEWNTEHVWPKTYLRVRDDGMVHVSTEVATDLEHGVTDDQLGQLLHCGLSSSSTFFDHLDALYPDPASVAP